MRSSLTYKGFIGRFYYSVDEGIYYGIIEGLNDLFTFEGTTLRSLTRSFEHLVDSKLKDVDPPQAVKRDKIPGILKRKLSFLERMKLMWMLRHHVGPAKKLSHSH